MKAVRKIIHALSGWDSPSRTVRILIRALCGVNSPSLGRRVRVSDIWKTKNYE